MKESVIFICIIIALFVLLFVSRNTTEGFQRQRVKIDSPAERAAKLEEARKRGPIVNIVGDATRREPQQQVSKEQPIVKQVVGKSLADNPNYIASVTEKALQQFQQQKQQQEQQIKNIQDTPMAKANVVPDSVIAPTQAITTGITTNPAEVAAATTVDNTSSVASATVAQSPIVTENVNTIQTGESSTNSVAIPESAAVPASVPVSESAPESTNDTAGFTGSIFNFRQLFSF